MGTTRHVSTYIERPVQEVYDYASDPTNLPEWAPGLRTRLGGRVQRPPPARP